LNSINHKIKVFSAVILSALIFFPFLSCKKADPLYKGNISLKDHAWLKNKKIFLDPGHGGSGAKDVFRTGPGGITEEEVNLKVSLILEYMLKTSGADVKMSRTEDKSVSLDNRVKMAAEFKPDLLISLHHNGSPRRADDINYPCVLLWGSRFLRPASNDFASYLLDELQKIMNKKGLILSDHSIFRETGTKILRETRYLCPGVIAEAGFFSNREHSIRLRDNLYPGLEAEAFFNAISKYFKRGIPDAEVIVSCPVTKHGVLTNTLKESSPFLGIRIKSGNSKPGIEKNSLRATLDSIPVKTKRIKDNIYKIKYGKKLYPGAHLLRFSFRNLRHQSSMILKSSFTIDINKGDYNRLVKKGEKLIRRKRTAKEGLKMLLSALSMELTGPSAKGVLRNIIRGFRTMGLKSQADYYSNISRNFYPDIKSGKTWVRDFRTDRGYRFTADYYGKSVPLISDFDK